MDSTYNDGWNRERCRRYYWANREAILEQKRLYHIANRDRILARKRDHYAEQRKTSLYFQVLSLQIAVKDGILEKLRDQAN